MKHWAMLKTQVSGILWKRDSIYSIKGMAKRMKVKKMNNINAKSGDISTIYEIVKPLLGHAAWNVKIGVGSFITMEFGDPTPGAHQRIFGEWYLWIYCCGWYLENPTGDFIGSEDPREVIKQRITILEGHSLDEIVISSVAFETNFVYDSGLVLHTFPLNFVDPCEYWKLFTPIGKVLVLGPATNWSFEPSSESRSTE